VTRNRASAKAATLRITVPIASVPNPNRHTSRFALAGRRKKMREAVAALAAAVGPVETPCVIDFTFQWPNNIVRDSHNFEVKGYLDGLVDAGVIPDDNDRIVLRTSIAGRVEPLKGSRDVTIWAHIETARLEIEEVT